MSTPPRGRKWVKQLGGVIFNVPTTLCEKVGLPTIRKEVFMAVHSLVLKRTSTTTVDVTLVENRKGYNVDAVATTSVTWNKGEVLGTTAESALITALEGAGIIPPDA